MFSQGFQNWKRRKPTTLITQGVTVEIIRNNSYLVWKTLTPNLNNTARTHVKNKYLKSSGAKVREQEEDEERRENWSKKTNVIKLCYILVGSCLNDSYFILIEWNNKNILL